MPQNQHVQIDFKFAQVSEKIDEAYKTGLAIAAEHLLGAAIEQAPEQVGTLHGSGAVTTDIGDRASQVVSFNTPYASRLHEHPEYDFSKDVNPNAKGKYLEDPANEEHQKMLEIVAKQIRQAGNG